MLSQLSPRDEGTFQEAGKDTPADRHEGHDRASDSNGASAGKRRGGYGPHRLRGEKGKREK